jgi:hypothetical protein
LGVPLALVALLDNAWGLTLSGKVVGRLRGGAVINEGILLGDHMLLEAVD